MQEQLISFETAKLAKEKGFDQENYYITVEQIKEAGDRIVTQSLLQKWLRENHHIHINIGCSPAGDGEERIRWYYSYTYGINDCLSDEAFNCMNNSIYNSFEEVLEEALKATLEILD